MDGLITLADLPELGGEKKPTAQIAIGRLDDNLRDPRYGKFQITQRQVDGWKRNLSDTFGGQVSIDADHSSDRGNGTRAAAWITGITQEGTANGSLINASVQFTPWGAKLVRDGDYKYTSPTFVENYTDEHGVKHGPALIGAALTNRPVLRKGMPTLSLSRDEFDGVATASAAECKRERRHARKLARELFTPRDSRAQMDLEALATLLDLDADADEATVLAKVTELKGADAGAAERKAAKKARKLARKAKESTGADQPVTLDADRLAQLLSDANAGASAATQLAEQTFTHAWEKALSEGRAAPSQEENLRELHKLDPALAIKTLDSFVQIVPTTPTGSGEGPAGEAPLGMDTDRYQLHTEAKALAARKLAADSKLDEAEAYILATQEIEDRKFTLENPGI